MTIELGPVGGPLLAVFAKRPVAGRAKTRLALATSPEWALKAAEAMLQDSLDRFAEIDWTDTDHATVGARRVVVYTPHDAAEYFANLAKGRFDLMPQAEDGDLGWRLRSFFDEVQANHRATIVVGTDSPTLPSPFVTEALRALDAHDIVIGPALDGGFYLLGMAQQRLRPFQGIAWSTSRVLEQMLEQIGPHAKIELLAPWYDIDTADDWTMMRGHIKAMRCAGLEPGAPRVERMINEQAASSKTEHPAGAKRGME